MLLTRYGSIPRIGSFGQLHLGIYKFAAIEREWLGNKPNVSCVPAGKYDLVPHDSPKYRHTFALVGDTVAHYKEDGKPRSVCLFHAANWPHELSGCIALGREITHVNGSLGVTHSNATMELFLRFMADNPDEKLIIKWSDNDV